MEPTPRIPSSDEADPDVQSSPAGLSEELEHEAEELDAEIGPDAGDESDAGDEPD
jgi:hypothetical protein